MTSPPVDDLTANQPGDAALAKAEEIRQSTPPPATWLGRLVQRLTGGPAEARPWEVGGRGEQLVGAELDRLPTGWRTLHAVPVGDRGSDIDHVVLGPGGVFTINAKHHPQ